ncbi:MAG TPA: ribonuclease III [Acetobacteraceae bacterium]|nr:ribonuclease III [Acetobacteraceae bacterium]
MDANARFSLAEELLAYRFRRPELLREALTHRSAAGGRARRRGHGSNERLEFIGDRVLGLLIAEWLAERFPDEQEGQLGPRHAYLVSREALAEVGQEIGFSRVLSLGANEALTGVATLTNVVADAMEAAIGAVYIDGGLEVARHFVRTAWTRAMEAQKIPPKDPKTALQEKLLGHGQKLPVYDVVASVGPSHAPKFLVRVSGGGRSATGEAGSKRAAERQAAASLLAILS